MQLAFISVMIVSASSRSQLAASPPSLLMEVTDSSSVRLRSQSSFDSGS